MTLSEVTASQHPNLLPAARERIFLRLGENGGLGADDHQWILYRGESAVSFVRSSKAVLVRCVREKGIELSAEGLAGLDALADGFAAWKADPSRKGTSIAPEALKLPETRLMGDTTPLEGGGGGSFTLVEQLGPNCAIGTDGRQWIVLRANGRVKSRYPSDGWNCVGYIHCDKQALVSCIKGKGLKLSAAGRAALDRQGDRIYQWRVARSVALPSERPDERRWRDDAALANDSARQGCLARNSLLKLTATSTSRAGPGPFDIC
jgi:hypothetical protein